MDVEQLVKFCCEIAGTVEGEGEVQFLTGGAIDIAVELTGLSFQLIQPALGGGELAAQFDVLGEAAVLGAVEVDAGFGIHTAGEAEAYQ